jgi:predicted outer membrane repeat protein
MEFKKSIIILIMAIFLISIAGVCASDVNDTAIDTQSNSQTELTQNDEINEVTLNGNDLKNPLEENNANQETILNQNPKSYYDLNRTVNNNTDSLIVLQDDYAFDEDTDSAFLDGITINHDVTIDGNGHIISGSSKAAGFYTSQTVLLKNIKFINCGNPNNASSNIDYHGHAVRSCLDIDYGYAPVDVVNCTFDNCQSGEGGAVYGVTARNCTFSNCRAQYGGVSFYTDAYNCMFLNNHAKYSGGAMEYGGAYDCYFEGNVAEGTNSDSYKDGGGAMLYGSCHNCTFVGNSARYGGAFYSSHSYMEIVNCTFKSNSAFQGGAIYVINNAANIIDCVFQNNKATNYGGAIYSDSSSYSKTVWCRFTGNTASESSYANTYHCNSYSPSFVFESNPLEVHLPNVAVPINISYSYNYYQDQRVYNFNGIDVTLKIFNYTNYNLIGTEYPVSGSLWNNSLDLGKYSISLSATAYGFSISSSLIYIKMGYPTVISLSSQSLNSSSSFYYVVKGNETYLTANLTDEAGHPLAGHYIKVTGAGLDAKRYRTDENGTFMIPLHTFELPEYRGSSYYLTIQSESSGNYDSSSPVGFYLNIRMPDDKVPKTFCDLNRTINDNTDSLIVLDDDYSFNAGTDSAFLMGITINREVTIDGNGHTIDGSSNSAKGFATSNFNIIFKNIKFVNLGKTTNYDYCGGAIYGSSDSIVEAQNCEFIGCQGYQGGALFYVSADNCTFKDCKCAYVYQHGGAAMYSGIATNCFFENNGESSSNGVMDGGTAINCTFKNNRGSDSGALYGGTAINCTFIGNRAYSGGAIGGDDWKAFNCTFINNTATYGGAVYANQYSSGTRRGYAVDCHFENNTASYGGAAYRPVIVVCTFKGNSATFGEDCYNAQFPEVSMAATTVIGNYPYVSLPLDLYYNNASVLPSDYYPDSCYHFKDVELDLAVYNKDQYVRIDHGLSGSSYDFDLESGTYSIRVSFTNSAYSNTISTDTYTLIVKGYKTVINATDLEIEYNNTSNLTVTLIAEYYGNSLANKTLTVIFNGNSSYKKTNEKGQISIDIPKLPAETYPVDISFGGDDVYEPFFKTVYVTVNKIATRLSSANVSAFYNEGKILAKLADSNGKPLVDLNVSLHLAHIHGTLKTNKSGEVEFELAGLDEGNYTAEILFADNSVYDDSVVYIDVNIYRLSSTITSDNLTFAYSELGILKAYLKDSNGNPIENATISIILDMINETLKTNADGEVNFNLTGKLLPGQFSGNLIFNLTNRYRTSSLPVNVTVNKSSTEISASDIICYYGDGKYLVVTLMDKYGNIMGNRSITINFNGKTQTYKTNIKGQVKVSTKGLVPKTYAAAITYYGDNNYVKSTASVKVTVKKAKPIIIAKKKTYKAKKKTKKFTITLKDNKGKAIKKAKVRLIVKKIKKTSKKKKSKKSKKKSKPNIVKTNKKGKAKFKIKRNKKGKYRAKIIYKGNKHYTKVVKKVKITIR